MSALRAYERLGISKFIISDTPYMQETVRIGDQIVSRMQTAVLV